MASVSWTHKSANDPGRPALCPLGIHLGPFVRQVQLPTPPPTSHCAHTDMASLPPHTIPGALSPVHQVSLLPIRALGSQPCSTHMTPGIYLASPHLTSGLPQKLSPADIHFSLYWDECVFLSWELAWVYEDKWINVPQQPEPTRSGNAGTIKVEHCPLEPMDQSRAWNSGLQENWPL